MKLSDNYMMVKLITVHPFFGTLDIDKFQRSWEECEMIRQYGRINWQGFVIPVKCVVVGTVKFPVYVFTVKYDWAGLNMVKIKIGTYKPD